MLKIKDGTVIEGHFNNGDYIDIVKKSDFSTLIIHINVHEFEAKCIEVVSELAEAGLQYAEDFVIARARNES